MARRKKNEDELRNVQINFRVNQIEARIVDREARAAGFADRREYARHRVLKTKTKKDFGNAAAFAPIDPGVVLQLANIGVQLKRIADKPELDASTAEAIQEVLSTITIQLEKVELA